MAAMVVTGVEEPGGSVLSERPVGKPSMVPDFFRAPAIDILSAAAAQEEVNGLGGISGSVGWDGSVARVHDGMSSWGVRLRKVTDAPWLLGDRGESVSGRLNAPDPG